MPDQEYQNDRPGGQKPAGAESDTAQPANPRNAAGGPGPKAGQGRGTGQNADQNAGQNAGQNSGQNAMPKAGPNAGRNPGGGRGGAGQAQPAVVEVAPIAAPTRMKRRHWGLLLSFLLGVMLPLAVTVFYLTEVAVDQYSSTTGFTIRKEEGGSASDLLGGLASITGSSTSSDADILYEYIQSQEIVLALDAELDLRGYYSQHWADDPAFSLWPDATIEDLLWFWPRVVRISYNQATGLIDLEVLAFDAPTAQKISQLIVRESQAMINDLNEAARADAMRYARVDLEESLARLKVAREALTQFRTRTKIVDPATDLQGRMGVLSNLQQQLAEALVQYDLVRGDARDGDPRLVQERRRIEVIRARIAEERQNFASADGSAETGGLTESYPDLIGEFESLSVDQEFAEETYRNALAALDLARANASRQSLYLAAYVRPTLAQSAEYPQRGMISLLTGLFLFLTWAAIALIYYSIRDRR
ncbi:sugar transporter [Salipiger aestuarii]|uniref:sugar transporter n=1 Tax=Salipiger aestuarii TaxID=568098 RepID=UPI001239F645|nr:sugar transporter [Salipiger aestuarii]KAA8606409.1 sugar transporter [Salipiger aestuarii]